jgi:hypothetical protein
MRVVKIRNDLLAGLFLKIPKLFRHKIVTPIMQDTDSKIPIDPSQRPIYPDD